MMNPGWRNYLLQAGAVIENGRVSHFGAPDKERQAALSGAVITDLSHYGLLRISGEDAQTFLQGQLTNDIRQVNRNRGQYSGYCSPKGRMLAGFLVWQGGDYYLQLAGELCANIHKRLSMFVLRAKVKISDASEELMRFGLSGSAAADALRKLAVEPPQDVMAVAHFDGCSAIRLPGGRFEIFATPEQAPRLWQELAPVCTPAGAPCWDWLEIRAGIPLITSATQEHFVPQMLNFELLGGISFNKGCYTGQEIVARTRYLGKLKRRMYLAHIETGQAPSPGDELFSADWGEQASGMLVNAQPAPGGGFDALAVIQISSAEAGGIHFKSLNGPVLQLESLPYQV